MVTQVPVDHIICADPGDFSKGESEGHLCLTCGLRPIFGNFTM